jgi:hypothetical protein
MTARLYCILGLSACTVQPNTCDHQHPHAITTALFYPTALQIGCPSCILLWATINSC